MNFVYKSGFSSVFPFLLTWWCHHFTVARQHVVVGTFALTSVEIVCCVHTDTLKLAAHRPHLALLVVLTVEVTRRRHVFGSVVVLKVTVGLETTLSRYLYQCALVWDVVVAGTFVVTLVPACAGVSTFTLVGTTVVPLVSLAVLDALVGTLVEEATSLCARTTVAARFSAVLLGPGSVLSTQANAGVASTVR